MTETVNPQAAKTRMYLGWFFLILAIAIWIPSGDVIDMIIRQKVIVFGRYSRGHFTSLFFLTLFFIGLSALCFSKIKTVGEMILIGVMVSFSTLFSGFVLVVGSSIIAKPRYVEQELTANEDGVEMKGLVRHRPPKEFFQLMQEDRPEQKRSYPDSPPGYPAFNVTLTTDESGFRNRTHLDHYPILAVGDSFVAGSQVSDDQAWVDVLAKKLNTDIYNLGVPGTDPGVYLNNFVLLGRHYKPKLVLFMIYEGNDFKDITPTVFDVGNPIQQIGKKSWGEKINEWVDASPVTLGVRRLSTEVFEPIGKDRPVPGYQQAVGWMPLKIHRGNHDHYYSFPPKRLTYLYEEKPAFKASASWQAITHIMQTMVKLGEQDGFTVLFLYAPSVPHVVMPLVRDAIPAEQLRNFASYQQKGLPPAEVFKKNVFDGMDNEQSVFMDECAAQQWHCLPLTPVLQDATAQGQQVYFSYDQHWTPDGNRVVADALGEFIPKIHF